MSRSVIVALVAVVTVVMAGATASAQEKPVVNGCELAEGPSPKTYNDQFGAYVQVFVKFQCPAPTEFTLTTSLFQEGIGGRFFEVGEGQSTRSGVDSAPATGRGAGPCESTEPEKYYGLAVGDIDGKRFRFQSTTVTLPCTL